MKVKSVFDERENWTILFAPVYFRCTNGFKVTRHWLFQLGEEQRKITNILPHNLCSFLFYLFNPVGNDFPFLTQNRLKISLDLTTYFFIWKDCKTWTSHMVIYIYIFISKIKSVCVQINKKAFVFSTIFIFYRYYFLISFL